MYRGDPNGNCLPADRGTSHLGVWFGPGAQVFFDGTRARVLYAGAGQINCVLPDAAVSEIQVRSGGRLSGAFRGQASPQVFISGEPAPVESYGEVAGVTQLSVRIPANVPPGDLPISVSAVGNSSQSGVTVSVRE